MEASGRSAPPAIDLVIVGGGITGCAAARDAAARGLKIHLLEADDLASGTSGRSTKLLHGGLRYLQQGRLRLVREALAEREITARLAPALASPIRFVLPVWPGRFPGRWTARLGVALYDVLAGGGGLGGSRTLSPGEVAALAPALAGGGRGGVSFADRQTDDARLTVAIARDAVRRGAVVRLGCRVTAIERGPECVHVRFLDEQAGEASVTTRCVLNATGPWADRVRALAGARGDLLRASRGTHLVFDGASLPLGAALLLPGVRPEQRLFAIPWRGAVLFGTTDDPDEGDPGRDEPEVEDLRALLDDARRLFPGAGLTRGSVLSAFTGVRPLLWNGRETLVASREHRVVDEEGLITIAGGKLTTWRTMAIAAIDACVRRLGVAKASPRELATEPLTSGAIAEPDLEDVIANEMPRRVEDVVFRRLPIGHDSRIVRRLLPSIVERMSARRGWETARSREETQRVLERLDARDRRLDEALGAGTSRSGSE